MLKPFSLLGGKLYKKILLGIISVSVLPIIILGVLSLYSLNHFHRLDVASIEENLINQKAEEIRAFLNNILNTLELTVSFEQIGDIEKESQNFLLKGLLESNPSLEEASFISLKSGRETARHNNLFPVGVPSPFLQDISRLKNFIEAKSGKNYIGPVYFTLRGPMVTVASPVKNKNGVVISVLTGVVNLNELQRIIESSQLGKDGYLYLLDENGFLIAHSNGDEIQRSYSKNLRHYGFVDELTGGQNYLGVEKQSRYGGFSGEQVVAAGSYLSDFNIALVSEWPTRDADRVVNTAINQILIISFLVMIATLLISVFLANRIVGPIKILGVGTERVAEGKFDNPVNIKTNDEIEDLGIAFNKMMGGLKRLQELKDEFVFVAAHELRTPVTAIKGYISLALDAKENWNDEVRGFLSQVKTSADRLNQLVNDLLQIARSEAGRLEIKVAPIDIIVSVKAVFVELKPLADEKSIKMVYDPPALPQVSADTQRLKEVMINLLGNAIKYTLGSGTITVSHELRNKELVTSIKDTGMGISAEAQKKLFEKFYRVQNEKTREITGTGLGLFIVKQIVEKMGGRIWVESVEGKGSTFSFSLLRA